jgi:nicotinamidase-related amidase
MASRVPAILDATDPCSPLFIPNSQTALFLMDYHNFVVEAMGEEGERAVSSARKMQEWAADNQILVVHCLVELDGQSPMPSSKSAGRFKVMQEMLRAKPASQDEDERLAKIAANEGMDARRPGFISVLQGPNLRQKLEASSVKSLILCGLSTSGCLLSTCRAATDAEYIVTVIEDACADGVPGLHDMLMKHVISSTAHVVKGAELIEAWKRRP